MPYKDREVRLRFAKDYHLENRDKAIEYEWDKRFKRPKTYLLQKAKARAKRRGFEFSITEEDFEIPTHCPILGIPLIWSKGKVAPGSYSLDKKDNTKGYVKGNVEVISYRANTIKSDMTKDELTKLYNYICGPQS